MHLSINQESVLFCNSTKQHLEHNVRHANHNPTQFPKTNPTATQLRHVALSMYLRNSYIVGYRHQPGRGGLHAHRCQFLGSYLTLVTCHVQLSTQALQLRLKIRYLGLGLRMKGARHPSF